MKKLIAIIMLMVMMQKIGYSQHADWYHTILREVDTAKSGWFKKISDGLHMATDDSSRARYLTEFANYYKFELPDSALFYGNAALRLARQIKFSHGEAESLSYIGFAQYLLGNNSKALQMFLQGLRVADKNNLLHDKAILITQIGMVYLEMNEYENAEEFIKNGKVLADSLGDTEASTIARITLVEAYLRMNRLDSAIHYHMPELTANELVKKMGQTWVIHQTLFYLGEIAAKKKDPGLALSYFRKSLPFAGELDALFQTLLAIAQSHDQMNQPDSAAFYAEKALDAIKERGFYSNSIKGNVLLSKIYEKKDAVKALRYSTAALLYKDSLDNLAKTTSFESLTAFDEQERHYEIETANAAYRNKIKMYVLTAALVTFSFIAFILFRNNRNKLRAKQKIEKAYDELKTTQAQLIQSAKMASLGELTAGIAHEIQNPLNFVNNFSEVNGELISELKGELASDNYRQGNSQNVIEIIEDLDQNLAKINQHGKRADAIVKGMLEHSRQGTGQKQLTDINALANEYLKLAYHGLRAKDKDPIAIGMKTNFDSNIGKINIVSQDIGRVLLNLYNNAFYAVREKEAISRKLQAVSFEPVVTVTTRKDGNKIIITVADNGNGIPQNVIDKIFQPFFTTKPTGQGTGLGLSLAYDIVKAHGGELKVESKEREGTTFTMQIPM